MDTNDLGPAFCDQLGFSKLDFGAWNRVMRKSRNCCKVRAVSSTFRWKIRFMSVSLCASLRSAMTRAIKADRLSEIGNRLTLALLCTLQTYSMAECLMASVASGLATALTAAARSACLECREAPECGKTKRSRSFLEIQNLCETQKFLGTSQPGWEDLGWEDVSYCHCVKYSCSIGWCS